MMNGVEALEVLSEHRGDEVVITHMTNTADWSQVTTRPDLDIGLHGAMGKASSAALGLALARPDLDVWVFDGDGSLLMNLGSLVTIAAMAPPNLLHVVYANDGYDTSGGQPLPGAGRVDFTSLARGAGYPAAYAFDQVSDLQARIGEVLDGPRPALVVLKVPIAGTRGIRGSRISAQNLARYKETLAQHPGSRRRAAGS